MLSNRILPNLMYFFIYSFHIFTYSHYSSMHIILSSHIYIRILYLSYILQYSLGLPKSQSQKVPIFSPKIWGLNHTAYYGPENSLCHYMTFIPSREIPYLVEFDETPRFWYQRVTRNAWINFISWSDQF